MNSSDLKDYIIQAFTSDYFVNNSNYPSYVNGRYGYACHPTTIIYKGFGDEMLHSVSDGWYFISQPNIYEESSSNSFNVDFQFGLYNLDDYILISFNVDKDSGEISNGTLIFYENGNSIKTLTQTAPPIPPSIALLPGLSSAFAIASYGQTLNTWIEEQGYNDSNSAKLQLSVYVDLFMQKAAFAVRALHEQWPISIFQLTTRRTDPFLQYINAWPSATPSVDGDWGNHDYFDSTFNGADVRCWRPVISLFEETWMIIMKYDHSRGFGQTDDHVIISFLGQYTTPDNTGAARLGNIISASTYTEFNTSGTYNFVINEPADPETYSGQDLLSAWADAFMEAISTEANSDIRNFGEGVATFTQTLIEYLQNTSRERYQESFTLNGSGLVSLAKNSDGQVFAASSGYVYLLSNNYPLTIQNTLQLTSNDSDASVCATATTVFIGIDGKVYSVPFNASSHSFGQAVQTSLLDTDKTHVITTDSGIYASCKGYVYKMNPGGSGYSWHTDLSSIVSGLGHHEVQMTYWNNNLYCASQGCVIIFDCSGQTPTLKLGNNNSYCDMQLSTHDITSVAVDSNGNIFCGSVGYLCKFDGQTYVGLWKINLDDVSSTMEGDHQTEVCILEGSSNRIVLVGDNGRVARFYADASSPTAIEDNDGHDNYHANKNGSGTTYVIDNGLSGLAACHGYVYALNPEYYSTEPSDAPQYTPYFDVGPASTTKMLMLGGLIYAGTKGTDGDSSTIALLSLSTNS